MVAAAIDPAAEPSVWLSEQKHSYYFLFSTKGVPSGNYRLGVAIVNSERDNRPEIKPAVANGAQVDGWTLVGDVTIQ